MARFLGLDCCTRNMKALIFDTALRRVIASHCLFYDEINEDSSIVNGIYKNEDPLVKHSNPLLWARALDEILRRLQEDGVDMASIDAISGSAQQHGTVYLNGKFLENNWLQADSEALADTVAPMLTRKTSPTWRDSSTFSECREIDAMLGGAANVRSICGSSAMERFAGPQIKRFAEHEPEAYRSTAVIHLVSSFLTSILLGKSAEIDFSDATGMNLFNLENMTWDGALTGATAPDLLGKLPKVALSTKIAGRLHPYFRRYGLKDIPVVNCTGDNPSILIGSGTCKPGISVIAFGTSDNLFTASDKPLTDPHGYGHLFLNPAGKYMPLTCFKNGSLAREYFRDKFGMSWQEFDEDAFDLTMPGNNGNIMLPYVTDEITPQAMNVGLVYSGNSLFKSHKAQASVIRGLVEAQAMTMRLHTHWQASKAKTIRVAGSGSRSRGICQVIADVFNAPVERLPNSDLATFGATLRTAYAMEPQDNDWHHLSRRFCTPDTAKTITPIKQNVEIYKELIRQYAALERSITGEEITLEAT